MCAQFDVPALVTNQKEFLQYGNGYVAKNRGRLSLTLYSRLDSHFLFKGKFEITFNFDTLSSQYN